MADHKVQENSTLKKMLHELRPYRLSVVAAFLCAMLYTVAVVLLPIFTGQAIDAIIDAGKVDFGALKPVLTKMLVTLSAAFIGQFVMGLCNNHIVFGVTENLRTKTFRHIQTLPISYFDRHPSGEILSRIISDADKMTDGLLLGFSTLFTGALTILGTMVFMFIKNVPLALVVTLCTPLSLLVARFVAKKIGIYFEAQAEEKAKETAFINEMIQEEKTVRAYAQEKRVLRTFDEQNEKLRKNSMKAVFFSSLVNPTTRFLNALIYLLVGGIGAGIIIRSGGVALTIGTLTCFLTYAGQFAKPFNEISGVIQELKGAMVSAARIFHLLELKGETEPEKPLLRTKTEGKVEFRNVWFSYTKQNPLIEDFNLVVNPGEHIAIVGKTGAGKTTLVNLLMRFYDPRRGQILVDGENTKELRRDEVRGKFGMVLQETFIRNASVYDNVRIGKPEALDSEIVDACKRVHADSFIRKLKDGYDTVLTENGEELSEGQKQLICIARVMLKLPPILVLDEATSQIDTRTEKKIQAAFDLLMAGRTSFIIAHRLSTIEHADRILVLDHGGIREIGTHEELLAKHGLYHEIYESQF